MQSWYKKAIYALMISALLIPAYFVVTAGVANAQAYSVYGQNNNFNRGGYGGGYGGYGGGNYGGSYGGGGYRRPPTPYPNPYPVQIPYPVPRPYPVPQPYPVYQLQPIYISQPVPQPVYIPQPVPQPIYYSSYSPLNVSCSANAAQSYGSNLVTWTAYASGGSGVYTNYSWSGTDDPNSLNTSSIGVYYAVSGTKTMNVTVWSGDGQTATANCGSVYVSVFNGYQAGYQYY